MAQQVFTITSSLTVDEAFERCIDLTRVNEWDRGVRDSRLVEGTGDTAGSKFEVTVTGFDGAPSQVVYELLEVDAPRRFVMEGVNDDFRAHDVLTFTDTSTRNGDEGADGRSPGGCELLYEAQLHLLGDDPPMSDEQLDALFARVAAVPEAGLRTFLNP